MDSIENLGQMELSLRNSLDQLQRRKVLLISSVICETLGFCGSTVILYCYVLNNGTLMHKKLSVDLLDRFIMMLSLVGENGME